VLYPYAEFLLDFERRHADHVHRNRPENVRAAVIVETRPMFFLPKVIRNVMYYLGEEWNLYVYGGPLSLDYVRDSLPKWEVEISSLPGEPWRLPIGAYNALMLAPEFWNSFSEEKILVFQTDSLLTSDRIGDFLDYDLVGAPIRMRDDTWLYNGGLSLRSRELMLKSLAEIPNRGEPEDVYFTRCARESGAALPGEEEAALFALETMYRGHPVGVHGTDKGMHPVELAQRVVSAARY
jgi:hypothetical protein